jgi:hypothetical protein
MIGGTSSAGIPAYHTMGIGAGPANLSRAALFESATAEYEGKVGTADRPGHTLRDGKG